MRDLLTKIDWQKMNHLVPAIIQHYQTKQILMLGYMNQEALEKTIETQTVHFFSRSKNRLWQKGETSGHYLNLKSIDIDCDQDTLLLQADPQGVTCHLGSSTCFKEDVQSSLNFIFELEKMIAKRKEQAPSNSYVSQLLLSGQKRIAQKVGEEGVEVALASMSNDQNEIISESADLLFHLLVLFQSHDLALEDVITELKKRSR